MHIPKTKKKKERFRRKRNKRTKQMSHAFVHLCIFISLYHTHPHVYSVFNNLSKSVESKVVSSAVSFLCKIMVGPYRVGTPFPRSWYTSYHLHSSIGLVHPFHEVGRPHTIYIHP
ncbi:hypothetical protein V8G54_005183 [Vigna mungo]|uniref:Uncharacterized protein n=1 Tax=Vigna mungo TaxID=3915 RepID=A0AAQ3PI68_VIGMU